MFIKYSYEHFLLWKIGLKGVIHRVTNIINKITG